MLPHDFSPLLIDSRLWRKKITDIVVICSVGYILYDTFNVYDTILMLMRISYVVMTLDGSVMIPFAYHTYHNRRTRITW